MKNALRTLALVAVMAFAAAPAFATPADSSAHRVKMTPEQRRDVAVAKANAKYEQAIAYAKMTPEQKLSVQVQKAKNRLAKLEAKEAKSETASR
jgi:hypothetical protein